MLRGARELLRLDRREGKRTGRTRKWTRGKGKITGDGPNFQEWRDQRDMVRGIRITRRIEDRGRK